MNAETTTAAVQLIPLPQLRLSPLNARKTGTAAPEDIAASISAIGLLQNLTVLDAHDGYEVIAGGRRLAALQLLEQRGELPASLEAGIPCRVIDNAGDVAIEASAAENTLRERMHPADEFDAFRAMVDNGKSIADVAAHFGVGEIVVKQRLKLANVAPDLVQLYRDNKMELDQLQALAVTDDHDAQRQVWANAASWDRDARSLRRALTRADISARSSVARFVGLDAYIAAGGAVRRDLFGVEGDAWLTDGTLLDKLALDKLEVLAQREREAGWAWVDVALSRDYEQVHQFPALPEPDTDEEFATPEDAAREAQILARREAIEALDDDDFDRDEDLQQEYSDLEDECEAIQARKVRAWPDKAKAIAGVLVYLDSEGLHIERGRLRPGESVGKAGDVIGKPKPVKDDKPGKPKKPELSIDMVQRLNLHRSAACRQLLVGQPALAVQLLTASMVAQVIDRGSGPFAITVKNSHRNTQTDRFPDLAKATARSALQDSVKSLIPPMKATEILPWVQKLSAEQLQQVQAAVAAVSLENLNERALGQLADQLGCNMAQWWEADGPRYLSNVPKALILEAVTEARGKDAAAKIANLKKDAVVAEAGKLLAGTGWLPKPLRGAGYTLAIAGTQAKPAPAAAKKAAARKSGSKGAAKSAPKKAAAKRASKVAAKKAAAKKGKVR